MDKFIRGHSQETRQGLLALLAIGEETPASIRRKYGIAGTTICRWRKAERSKPPSAFAAGKDSPTDGVAFIKESFGIELSNAGFSTLKTQLKKAGTKPAATRGRPAGKVAATASTNGHGSVAPSVAAIKKLVYELGAEQVKQIADIVK